SVVGGVASQQQVRVVAGGGAMALRLLPVRGLQARSPGPKCAVIFHPFPQLSPVPQASSASLPIGDQTVKRPRLVGSVYDLSGTTQLPYTSPRPYPAGSS